MDLLQAIILAAIQGLTEFLPISSSGHLVLPQTLLGWQDQGLAFDVAVHVGSLLAVLWFFRRDVSSLLSGWGRSVTGGGHSAESRLAWYVIVATVPAVLAGLLFNDVIETRLRSGLVLAMTTLIWGVALGAVDYFSTHRRHLADITLGAAVFVGAAQALALVPGTSRSGITITAALLLGFSRSESARFSFLLSMPIIAAAGCYKSLELIKTGPEVPWSLMGVGVMVSGITAYLCIKTFMAWVERIGMMPFAVYRVLLAFVILAVISG